LGGFGLDADYPNTELLVGAGFFIVLFIEQAILCRQEGKKTRQNLQPAIGLSELDRHQCKEEVNSISLSDVTMTGTGSEPQCSAVQLESLDNEPLQSMTNHSHKIPGTGFRFYVLLMALSVHSLFEGLALGLEDNGQDLLQLLYALVAHKSVLAFSLGSSLVMSGMMTSSVVKSCILFSLMCPTGISIGIAIIKSVSTYSSYLVAGLFQGLAAGTFIYVTFFEVMAQEFNLASSTHRLWKVLFTVLGFASVAFAHFFHAHAFGPPSYKNLCVENGTVSD
jgi:zinc transporter 1/2/3